MSFREKSLPLAWCAALLFLTTIPAAQGADRSTMVRGADDKQEISPGEVKGRLDGCGNPNRGSSKFGGSTSTPCATLTVTKRLVPTTDTAKFNLKIDGVNRALAVGNNGTTGPITLSVGVHSVGEAPAGGGFSLYSGTFGGDCDANGKINLTIGQNATCTITNQRRVLNQGTLSANHAILLVIPIAHGTWTRGPGTYSFSACDDSPCDIVGSPGQTAAVTLEAWSGGGAGAGGATAAEKMGGPGGGGGGGGGYAKAIVNVVIPANGTLNYYVAVGSGGAIGPNQVTHRDDGFDGGATEIRLSNAGGTLLVKATGGQGGKEGYRPFMVGPIGGQPGTGVLGSPWAGTPGGAGAVVSGCNGGAGGLGGAGGGPGRINDGGIGGHGGYYNNTFNPTCTAHGLNYERSEGAAGGNGKVVITW